MTDRMSFTLSYLLLSHLSKYRNKQKQFWTSCGIINITSEFWVSNGSEYQDYSFREHHDMKFHRCTPKFWRNLLSSWRQQVLLEQQHPSTEEIVLYPTPKSLSLWKFTVAVYNVIKWDCHGTISWEFMRKKLRTWYPPVRIFNFFSILAALFASRVMCPRFCSRRFSCDSRRSFLLARFARVYRFWLGRKSTYVMWTNTS